MIKIPCKITGVSVVKDTTNDTPGVAQTITPPTPILPRPKMLEGATYKIKTPVYEHALYVTINDVETNGKRRPFEIFVNSKNMENFAWVTALTRVLSAVFRHDEDPSFVVEELQSVFDPRGGYFQPGGKYMPSLVAEIGECIQQHLGKIGWIQPQEPSPELLAKRQTVQDQGTKKLNQCPKCNQFSLAKLDGCDTCLDCGYSKCG